MRTELGRKIREAFRPEKEGWSYLAADYSQIELRLSAHLSEDPTLIRAFINNEDIHAYTASCIFTMSSGKGHKRTEACGKSGQFRHHLRPASFRSFPGIGYFVKTAAAFIETYFKRYPNVKELFENNAKKWPAKRAEARDLDRAGKANPGNHSKNGIIRAMAERLAVNTPIQGTAADLIKLAMLEIDRKIAKRNLKGYMILQIHDELIF